MAKEGILRVYRTKSEAKASYDMISGAYDYFAEPFESKFSNRALDMLNIKKGETVLEIGFGTGHCMERIATEIGTNGKAFGIDISSGMLKITKRRLARKNLEKRVKLTCGDATHLPYKKRTFDAVFMSFTLELFDTPEIPIVLKEIKRVLKPNGRLCVVSMEKEGSDSWLIKLYEWFHKVLPNYVDCRPIYVKQSISDAGYSIKTKEKVSLLGLPGSIVVAKPRVR